MLSIPSQRQRLAGKLLIALTGAAVLPLTASWAVRHVDVPAPAPAMQARPAASLQPGEPARPAPAALASVPETEAPVREMADGTVVLPGGVTLGRGSIAFFADDRIVINGRVTGVEQLTRAERSQLRAVIVRSRRRLERERAELPARLARAELEADRIRSGAFRRELLNDRDDIRRALAEIDSEETELRANGEDPERMRAELREDLREAEARDIDREVQEALEEADPTRIVGELRAEEAQMERLLARLGQLDRR